LAANKSSRLIPYLRAIASRVSPFTITWVKGVEVGEGVTTKVATDVGGEAVRLGVGERYLVNIRVGVGVKTGN
jgi:hypothetical protein